MAECLDSCLAQDLPYDDYEIICVNDGSKDGSLAILRSYEAKYPNLIVIDQPNSGVSAARNAGMDIARGDYIWFVDSDDFIQENCLSAMKARCSAESPDRLTFRFFEFHNALTETQLELKRKWLDIPDSHMGYSGICSGLFKRSVLLDLGLHFPKMTHGEDVVFVARFWDQERIVTYLEKICYYYRRNPDSVTLSRTPESSKNYLNSHIQGAVILDELYRHNQINRSSKSLWLMHFLHCVMIALAKMPRCEAAPYLLQLKSQDLFPYAIPVEYPATDTSFTTRKDIVGSIYNWIVIHSCSRFGYFLLRSYYRLFYLVKR